MNKLIVFLFACIALSACNIEEASLPYLGRLVIDEDGNESKHVVKDFSFINQFGDSVSNVDFDGNVYVADFFFTSCPTICPVMKTQMLRVYEHFEGNQKVKILSHTIDPYHDSVAVLHKYAEDLGVRDERWNFVTGEQDDIYYAAEKSYMVAAQEDTVDIDLSGGFIHSGAFILIDGNRHPRGIYDGTVELEVNQLIRDIELLLKEE